MEAWKNEHDMHRTLGWAIGILGHRKCQYTRDYFLALGKMLDFRPEQDPLVLIENRFEYFFSLATFALQEGDYSPLLFIPSLGEDSDPRAPWLRGHTTGTWKLWDMGRCHRKATSQPIIRDSMIQPQLQTVGVIESFEYYDFGGDAESVMDYVVSKVVRASGRDAQALCEAVDRIFPRNEEKAVNMEWKDSKQEDVSSLVSRYDLDKIQGLLEKYGPLLDMTPEQEITQQRFKIAKKLIRALKLSKEGKHARESRLELAAGEADWFLREYGTPMEGISQIRCKICGRWSVFRLVMWGEPTPDVAQVYRIPGLLYDENVPDGIGIVVERDRIIGKMIYGTPACRCCQSEFVKLGSANL